jgi:CDP-diacylglycerol--serine O-phosphatidyltransferase
MTGGSASMGRKWRYVLPNSFTVASIFCGIYAITEASAAVGATDSARFLHAAVAILVGMFCDGLDGRVARLTGTESDFGVQLDSLADVITFGAAPAILLYRWALAPTAAGAGLPAPWGIVVAGIYASCGALRLARFNVMASRSVAGAGPSSYFTGLPIPLAAGMVVAVVIAATRGQTPFQPPPGPIALLTIVLSYLMISTIPYHSFKKVRMGGREVAILVAVLLIGMLVGIRVRPSFVPVAYFSGYVLLGLIEDVLLRHKRAERLTLAGNTPSGQLLDDGEEAEESGDANDVRSSNH